MTAKTLGRAAILGAKDMLTLPVPTPEWGAGTQVLVRTLSAAERDDWEASITVAGKVSRDNIRARLVALTVVDESGERIFKDEDADLLGEKNGKVVDRIFDLAARLSGISSRDIDELEKNSASEAADASCTVSQDT